MRSIHSIFKALFLFLFVTTSLQAQYSTEFETQEGIISYVKSCLDGASNITEASSVQTFQHTSSKTYIVEMLGKRGTLVFDEPISSQPASGLISLKNLKQGQSQYYNIINGEWSGNQFRGEIRDNNDVNKTENVFPGLHKDVNKIQLIFPSSGTYKVVGALNAHNDGFYAGDNYASVIIGYNEGEKDIIVQSESRKFAVVLRDKHAEKKSGENEYKFRWYFSGKVVETSTYKELLILKDDLYDEVALYAFNNPEGYGRTLEEAKSCKVLAYDTEEIYRQIKTLLPASEEWGTKAVIKADMFTNIVSYVVVKYPSDVFGLKSTGHGNPYGIMNGFLSRKYLIERSLSCIQSMRKKPIDFVDVNTNCNAGSYSNLSGLAPYSNYFMASDLTRYPTNSDDYQTFFSNTSTSVKDILINIMKREERVQREDCHGCKKFLMQVTLFDNHEFVKMMAKLGPDFKDKLREAYEGSTGYGHLYYNVGYTDQIDFKTGVPVLVPNYSNFNSDWDRVVIKQMDNRSYVNPDVSRVYQAKGLILRRS